MLSNRSKRLPNTIVPDNEHQGVVQTIEQYLNDLESES